MSEIECAQLHSELFRRRHSTRQSHGLFALAKHLYILQIGRNKAHHAVGLKYGDTAEEDISSVTRLCKIYGYYSRLVRIMCNCFFSTCNTMTKLSTDNHAVTSRSLVFSHLPHRPNVCGPERPLDLWYRDDQRRRRVP